MKLPVFSHFASLLVLAGLLLAPVTTEAQLNITITQNNPNVDCIISGSLDTSNTAFTAAHAPAELSYGVRGAQAWLGACSDIGYLSFCSLSTTSYSFGTNGSTVNADSVSGMNTNFVLSGSSTMLFLDEEYVSGTSITGSMSWEGESVASLGLASGDYTFTIGNSTAAETIHVTISSVPEPSTYALISGLGVWGLVFLRRRRS